MGNENDLFEQAVNASKKLEERPDNETMLKLYALYKQKVISVERNPGFSTLLLWLNMKPGKSCPTLPRKMRVQLMSHWLTISADLSEQQMASIAPIVEYTPVN